MNLIDAHCHLEDEQFDADRDSVVEQCKQKMRFIISSGINIQRNADNIAYSKKWSGFVYCTLGFTPSSRHQPDTPEAVEKQIRDNADACVGVGEIGLDYHWETDQKKQLQQRKDFEHFLSLANELKKPVVIHSRKAMKDTFDLLSHFKGTVMLHCFSGNTADAKHAVDQGYFVSLATNQLENRSLIKALPLESILVETDSPFLWKGRNAPYNTNKIITTIASIKNLSDDNVADSIFENALRAFPDVRKSL